MLLVFGIGFEIPLFVVLLNLAGVVSGQALGRYRPWIIIGTAVFAAVATPSTDPFGMLMLAIPMLHPVHDRRDHRPDPRQGPRPRRVHDPEPTSPTTRSRPCELADRCRAGRGTSTRSTCPTGWAPDA